MSPDERLDTRSLMVASTAAAGTISQMARGVSSFLTRSAIDVAPTAFARVNSSTAFGDLSKTTHRWPPPRSRRTMFAPIRPSPIIPICMAGSFQESIAWRTRFRTSSVGRLEDALNRCIQQGVVFGIGLLGRQPLDQRPRIARHDLLIPPQAPVAFY